MVFLQRREFLLDISSRFSRATHLHHLLKDGVQHARELMRADRGTIFVVDEEKQIMWTEIAEKIDKIVLPLGNGLVGACYNGNKMLNIANAKK